MFNILKKSIEKKLILLVIATGIASVATQLVMIREFLSLFSGNEFIISIVLFNWLVLGGIGTFLARIKLFSPSLTILPWICFGLCILGCAQIIGARILYDLAFTYGASKDFYSIFIFSFLICTPYCILVGFLLIYSLDVIKTYSNKFASVNVYIADNFGDALGGALFSFILVFLLSPVQAVFFSSLPLLLIAFIILKDHTNWSKSSFFVPGFAIVLMLGLLPIEKTTLFLPGSKLLFYKETPYGRVEIHKKDDALTFYSNKIPLFDNKNSISAEQIVHFCCSQIKSFENVLFISASAGVFKEIEKYNFKKIDYIEIDPAVSKAMIRFSFLKNIKNLNIINDDALKFLKHSKTLYDAIIIDVPEPDTFQANRFYTMEFFNILKKRISQNSVISFSIQGYDNYPSKGLLKKISSLYNTSKAVFKNTLILPGAQIFFILSNQKLKKNIPDLLKKKNISTNYIQNYFAGDITDFKINRLMDMLEKNIKINRDYTPVLIKYAFKEWFEKFNTTPLMFSLVLALFFIIYIFFISDVETILFLTGFSAMGSELMIIFAFQIIFGFVYLKTGVIITLFLAGLLPGALLGEKISSYINRKFIFYLDLSIIFSLFLFTLIIYMLKANIVESFFYFASFGFAFLCGLQFSGAIIYKKDSYSLITRFFAADLIGGAAGIVIFSLLLMPYLGILQAGILLCLIKSLGVVRFTIWKK